MKSVFDPMLSALPLVALLASCTAVHPADVADVGQRVARWLMPPWSERLAAPARVDPWRLMVEGLASELGPWAPDPGRE